MPIADPTDPRFARLRELGGDRYAAFLAAGYREWYAPAPAPDGTPYLLQKAIEDPPGFTLFLIDIFVYDFSPYPDRVPSPVAYSPEAHFNQHMDQAPAFNVKLFHRDGIGADDIEAFFLKIYRAMGCSPCGD